MSPLLNYSRLFNASLISDTDPHFGAYQLERREIGELLLPTGKIVANDPLVFWQTEPFTRTVPPGKYPVSIFIAHFRHKAGEADERIAYALVMFKSDTPANWEMALLEGQDVTTLEPGYFFGYGVDAGTGSFMDEAAAQLIKQKISGLPFDDSEKLYAEPLMAALDATYRHTHSYANYEIDPASGLNVVAFSSGWGDGSYPSYWGLDTGGELICLLTDFHLFA